jgi:hypothetical protein
MAKLVYKMVIWYILWPFGIFHGRLAFFRYVVPSKIWQPCPSRLNNVGT